MELTSNILAAQVYSLKQHMHKTYGEDIPYAVHIILVVSIIQKYLNLLPPEERETAIISGWLHDVCEDSGISYNEIKKIFGFKVAEVVGCVTNEWGRTRDEKAEKTYPKTASNRLAVFVKLADRLGNTQYSKMNGSGMFERYTKEFDYFCEILYLPGEYETMWKELAELTGKQNVLKAKILTSLKSA